VSSSPTLQQTAADNQVAQLLDAARNAFAGGDYQTAMTQVNQSIAKRPNDVVLHEFRALILFATMQYKAAAGAVYAVLSVGPGWDWATLSSFYPDPEVYSAQLRSLEQYRNKNLNLAEARFLLAYHYMSCGHPEAATVELKEVMRINPKDQLAGQVLAGLSGDKAAAPPAAGPVAANPPAPVNAASLVGNWEATRTDGSSFSFNLTANATYSWKYTRSGKVQEYTGAYTVADNLLILKQGGSPVLIGQVALVDGNRFSFKLVGNNPSDPGLTFSRK
jgi:tetratricopeptide (TPR) repeat protein